MYCRRSPQSFVLGARDVLKVLKKPVLPVGKVEVCTLIQFSTEDIQSNVRDNKKSLLCCSPFKFNLTIHGDIEKNPGPDIQKPTTSDSRQPLISQFIKPAKKVARMRVSPPKKKSRLYASPPSTPAVPVQKEVLPVEFLNIQIPPGHCYLFLDIETLTTKNLDKVKITKKKKKKHADTSDTVDLDTDLEQDLPEIKEVTGSEKLAPDLEKDEIIMIGCRSMTTSESGYHLFTTKALKTINDCSIHCCINENQMLVEFCNFLTTINPSLILGYNLNNFDIPSIVERCKKYKICVNFRNLVPHFYVPPFFERWVKDSPLGPFKTLDLYTVIKSAYIFKGGRALENVVMKLFDMQQLFEYSLINNTVKQRIEKAKSSLKGRKKDPNAVLRALECSLVEESKLRQLETKDKELIHDFKALEKLKAIRTHWNGSIDQRTVLGNYCKQDVFLVEILFDHFSQHETQRLLNCPAIKVVKCGLHSILRHLEDSERLKEIVENMHIINFRGRLLLQLVLLREYDRELAVSPNALPSLEIFKPKNKLLEAIWWCVSNADELDKYWEKNNCQELLLAALESEQLDTEEEEMDEQEIETQETTETKKRTGVKSPALVLSICKVIEYFKNDYQPILDRIKSQHQLDPLSTNYLNMAQILKYLTVQVRTEYANHLQEHFHELIFRVFNVCTNKKRRIDELKGQKEQRHLLLDKFNASREAIEEFRIQNVDFELFESPERDICVQFKKYLGNEYQELKIAEKNLYYCEKVNPIRLLPHSIFLSRLVQNVPTESNIPLNVHACFPQCTSMIPINFRLDTRSINQLFHRLPGAMSTYKGKYKEYGRLIWNSFIKLEGTSQEKANCFKNTERHYQFKNSIVTDGYSCSVTLIRKDLVEKDYTATQLSHTEQYLEDLSEERIKELKLQEKRCVAIDPNAYTIVAAVSKKTQDELLEEGIIPDATTRPRKIIDYISNPKRKPNSPTGKKRNRSKKIPKLTFQHDPDQAVKIKRKDEWKKFTFSQGERNFKKKFIKNRKKEETMKKTFKTKDGRTIQEAEAQFSNAVSNGQRKSCFPEIFKQYIFNKELYNTRVFEFWSHPWFRKRKFTVYSDTQRMEATLLKDFKTVYGGPETTIIGYGDWDDSKFRKKGGMPTVKGKTTRNLLRRAYYKVFLLDEYRTSKCCSACARQNEMGVFKKELFVE
ncbi:hypothetical protein RCL1_003214 [Eukaryota sp. TZLM3-RCL]